MVNKIDWPQLARIAKAIAVLHLLILAMVLLAGCGGDDGRDSVKAQRDRQYSQLATADARTAALVPTITTEPLPSEPQPAPTFAAFTPTPPSDVHTVNVFAVPIEAEEVMP